MDARVLTVRLVASALYFQSHTVDLFANHCGHVFANPEHVPSRLHLPDRDMFTETTRLFACVLVVQWLAVVAFTYWMAPTHVVAAFFAGGVLSLIPMALAIVRGRGARQALAERTAALHDSLHEYQERYRAIVDRAEGIFLADAATKELIECNAALGALLGYSAEETARLTLYDFDGDTRDSVDAAVRQLTDGKRPLQLDRRYRHKDQSIVEVTLHASVFMQGTRAIVCGAVRDVTALRDSESQLRQAQKMEAIGQLAGGIAHDFNNLLTVHPRLRRARARDARPGHPADADVAGDEPRRTARRGTDASAAGVQPAAGACSARCSTSTPCSRMRRKRCSASSASEIELVLELEPDLRGIEADAGQLEQVIVNLGVNARDAMPTRRPADARDRARRRARPARMSGAMPSRPAATSCSRVTDSGCGMSAEVRRTPSSRFSRRRSRARAPAWGSRRCTAS